MITAKRINRFIPFLAGALSVLLQGCSWFVPDDNVSLKGQFQDTLSNSSVDSSLFLFPRNFFLVSFEFEPQTRKMSKEALNEFNSAILLPGYSYIDSLRQSGVPIFGGVFAVKQGCAFMIQAETNEKLHKLLENCPLNPVSKISVTPLVSMGQYLFEIRNRIKQPDSAVLKSR